MSMRLRCCSLRLAVASYSKLAGVGIPDIKSKGGKATFTTVVDVHSNWRWTATRCAFVVQFGLVYVLLQNR
eukprot:scaffold10766_cov95-Skeletonema_dohrnii-CCMP3373.AAC.2